MAADFTVLRARFLSSLLVIAALGSCQSPPAELTLNRADVRLKAVGDVMYFNKARLTGKLYTLFRSSRDTAEIAFCKDGRENGVLKRFYPGGALKDQREFENGKKIGKYISWWQNGKKKLEYVFENDEYQGTSREWNESGMLVKEMNYEKGHEQGSQKVFYDNGKVRANYVVIDGRRYGLLGTKNCVNASDSVFKN